MSTKKLGYILAVFGALAIFLSFITGYIGLGDSRIGSSQLLGIEIGVLLFLGALFLRFSYPDHHIYVWRGIRNGMQWLLNLAPTAWVVVGFLIIYLLFFLFPVFFNSEHIIWYFGKFLPNSIPIGWDIRATLDYINNWLVFNVSPFHDGAIAYPPLLMVLFAPFLLFGYPNYFYLLTIANVLFYIGSTLLLPLSYNRWQNASLIFFVFALGLFSYGFQFELERGQWNILAFALSLIGIYLYHKNEDFRFPAYFLFTLGVQLKIYPVLLIVMFIKDWRDWRGNMKRIAGLALLNFALLFVLGIRLFGDFLHSLRGFQSTSTSSNANLSLKGFVNHLAFDGFGVLRSDTLAIVQRYQGWIELSLLVILILCFLAPIVLAHFQRTTGFDPYLLVICTICSMVIPSISNDYKLPILTAPMILLWSDMKIPNLWWKKGLAAFLIVVSSMAYWLTQYPFEVKPYFLTRNFPALLAMIVAVTILRFLVPSQPNAAEHGTIVLEDQKLI